MNTEPLQPLEAEAEPVKGRDQMGVPAATPTTIRCWLRMVLLWRNQAFRILAVISHEPTGTTIGVDNRRIVLRTK